MHNILMDRFIRFKRNNGCVDTGALPQVYAALMKNDVVAFPALRPHQRHAWHAFLVQLGAMAMHKAGLTEQPPEEADEWLRIIRALTPGFPDDEPWHLVVEDITKPAFMQPPASSEDKLADYKSIISTPDELDMLVTSKNHDLKAAVGSQSNVDDWIFSLITLQTMEGYSGLRNYGISRMPSGYGNRPVFSITPSTRPGVHVKRDIIALMEHRQTLADDYEYPAEGGVKLLWIEVWNGAKSDSILVNRLDPLYIEICRRIRLRWSERRFVAVRANSSSKRIVDVKGLTGDPWAPENTSSKGTPTAFLGPRKFGYERVVGGLTSPDWKPPYLLNPMQSERGKEMQLVARGMIRGEGGTSGYHERTIPLKPKVMLAFGRAGDIEELGDISHERITQIGKVKSVLRYAVATFSAHGDSGNLKTEDWARANPWADKLDEIVDSTFFDDLQDEFEIEDTGERQQKRNEWLLNGKNGVIDHARRILRQAEDSLPCPSTQRFRARVNANSAFEGSIKGGRENGLPFLFERQEDES